MFNNKLFYYSFLIFLLIAIMPMISAVPPVTTTTNFPSGYAIIDSPQNYLKQNQDYTYNFFVRNASNGVLISNVSTNCSFYLSNSSGNLIYSSDAIYVGTDLGYWYTLISGGNFSETGVYSYGIKCEGVSFATGKSGVWEVTPNGLDLPVGNAFIYIGLLIVFVIFLIGTVVIFMSSENLLSRVNMIGLGYLLLIAINFIAWNMASDFLLSAPFIASMFRIIFFVLIIGLFPLVIAGFIYYLLMLFKIKEIERLMTRGLSYEDADRRVRGRRR